MTEKAFLVISRENHWKTHKLVCKFAGKRDGYKVFHPLTDSDYTSIRVDEKEPVAHALIDGNVEELSLDGVIPWTSPHTIHISGHSDDCIVINGDYSEQLYANYNAPTIIRANGVEITIEFSQTGVWEFHSLEELNGYPFTVSSVGSEAADIFNDYTELLTIGFDEPIESIEKVE